MAERDSALKRVRALMTRALHDGTPPEESRTSAVIACKLIAKHGLLDAPTKPATQGEWYATRPTDGSCRVNVDRASWFNDYWGSVKRAAAESSRATAKVRYVRVDSKHDGWCRACGERFAIGDPVVCKPRYTVHWECRNEPDA